MKITEPVLIVPEPFVDEVYPGGIEAFVAFQTRKHGESLRIVRTDQLVAFADTDERSLIATYERLCNFFHRSPGEEPPCVFVDPVDGVMEPCDWLLYSPEDDGSAEVVFAEAMSDFVDDEEYETPAAQDDAECEGEASTPTLMKLSEDGGFLTWLDLETGRQLTSVSIATTAGAEDDADAPRPMLQAVTAMIAARGWNESMHDDEEDIVTLRLDAGSLLVLSVAFVESQRGDALVLAIRLPGCTPARRRDAVANYLAGANWGLEVGGFDIDYSDGEVIYRASLIAHNGQLRPSAVRIALDRSMGTVTFYAAGLIEVANGADPRETLARIEKR